MIIEMSNLNNNIKIINNETLLFRSIANKTFLFENVTFFPFRIDWIEDIIEEVIFIAMSHIEG
jgi:hypothetical protein